MIWRCATYEFDTRMPIVMGILNVTPDSFSDGGQHDGFDAALAHAERMAEEGARIIDVGGESTRPGAAPVSVDEELARVLPVVRALAQRDVCVSIDTRHAEVARACLEAGAAIVNDVSGFRDPAMVDAVRDSDCGLVVMHMQGDPSTMQNAPSYDDVVADVRELSFDGEALHDKDGQRIDAVWRRCVTNDVIDHWDDSQELLNAVRAEKVALIGSFAGHIVHDKQIFKVLFDERTLEFLDGDEISFIEETVPMTAFLDDDYINVPQIRANKDEWIIKPTDHYGADDVYAGCYVSQEEWEGLIDKFANGRAGFPFIVQRYIRPFKTETLPPDAGIDQLADDEVSDAPKLYNNLNGLYLYDGVFQGVFSRLGPLPTISKDMQGMTAATIWVD